MENIKKISYLALLSSALFSVSSFANAESKDSAGQKRKLEELVVNAHLLGDGSTSQLVDVLAGSELDQELNSSLGETIANQPGVRSANFGGAVGRPIIHGLGGARVKTTEDRIDSLDVSITSADHAVTVEPFIANQVSILKGASTLIYGSGAIGGVVDVTTGRIPTELDQSTSGKVLAEYMDNASGHNLAGRFDTKISENVAFHIDAFSKQSDDYEFAGSLESRQLMALEAAEGVEHGHDEHEEEHHDEDEHEEDEHEDEHEEEHHDEDEHHDEHGEEAGNKLVGSRYDVKGASIGASFKGENSLFGFSVSRTEADYGLVGHSHDHGHGEEEHGHEDHDEDEHHEDEHGEEHADGHHDEEHGEEHAEHSEEEDEEPGRLDLEQTRIDLLAQLNDPFNNIETLTFRFGINDYEHNEVEGSGEVGTVFKNDAWEGRIELSHYEISGFSGTAGIQLGQRDFSAIGEEAFVPPVESDGVGLFWVGERNLGAMDLETGFRVEKVDHDSSVAGQIDQSFSLFSTSVGLLSSGNGGDLQWSALVDYSQRAPSIEELYSNGPHLATETFEIGDQNLDKESAIGLTAGVNKSADAYSLNASVYINKFDNFIYLSNTGGEEDGLPVYVYQQHDTTIWGFDVSGDAVIIDTENGQLSLGAAYEQVNAELDDGSNAYLPRTPGDRSSLKLVWEGDEWLARLRYSYVAAQDDVAQFELPTDSYDDISLYLEKSFALASGDLSVYLRGKNLSDEAQREHTSFIKDIAPAKGRSWYAGVRFKF